MKPACYAAVTKIESKQWKEEATDTAIKAELKMLFKDLKALQVIRRAQAKAGKILKSHMFVVIKYLANGQFDKVKARFVADGRDQDPEMFPNKASPTVAIHSVLR